MVDRHAEQYPKFIRITPKAHAELKEAAEDRGMTIPDLASRLIHTGIDRLEPVTD